MKRFKVIAVAMLLAAVAALSFTACSSVKSIAIAEMPRTTFVQGQELDLSGGKLAVTGKGTEQIDLNSADVSVSGYDKNTLGVQELTVKYKGKTVPLTVTVIARVAAENAETSYFVGEPFNAAKGRLRVANDDGTTFVVPMNDAKVSVEGFDSSAAKAVSVTVRYRDGEKDYTGTFDVNVYELDANGITFRKPNKIEYKSHEAGIDLAGGYITVKAGGGALTRNILLNESMISGFDLSKATMANVNDPLAQTVTVNYASKTYTFEIKIKYSNVSIIKQRAEELSVLDWSKDTLPAISDEQGGNALDALEMYYDLVSAEKELISEEEQDCIVRAAAVYGYGKWADEVKSYEHTFTVDEKGKITFVGESYDFAVADYAKLSSSTAAVFELGDFLTDVAKDYKDVTLTGETTVAGYLSGVYGSTGFAAVRSQVKYMIDLYDTLQSNLVSSWQATEAAFNNYGTQISAVLRYIAGNQYKNASDAQLYKIVTTWHNKNDFFDILYAYCYYGKDATSANALKNLYLPEQVETFYLCMVNAIYQQGLMSQNAANDTTRFMMFYFNALEERETIQASGLEMEKWLYNSLTFQISSTSSVSFDAMLELLRTSQYGYFQHANAMLGDKKFDALWTKYLSLMNAYADKLSGVTDENVDAEEILSEFVTNKAAEIETLWANFIDMSPSWQFGFLASLNTFYRSTQQVPPLTLDLSKEGRYNYFAYFLGTYYEKVLSENGYQAFCDLLIAVENYARRFNDSTALGKFTEKMSSVTAAYANLENADKAKLGAAYTKYNAIATRNTSTMPELGEYASKFEALKTDIKNVYIARLAMTQKLPTYTGLFAAYEHAESLAQEILDSENGTVIEAFYHQNYQIIAGGSCSYDYAMYCIRSFFVGYMEIPVRGDDGDSVLWDLYMEQAETLRPFMKSASYVVWTYFDSITGDEEQADSAAKANFDAESVYKVLAEYRALSVDAQRLFLTIELNSSYMYYSGLQEFFKERFGSEESGLYKLAVSLLGVERTYVVYAADRDGATTTTPPKPFVDSFKEAWETAAENKNKLTTEEQTKYESDAGLKALYEFYKSKYDEVNGSASAMGEIAA